MFPNVMQFTAAVFAGIAAVQAASCPTVSNDGVPTGQLSIIDGVEMYQSHPINFPRYTKPANSSTAILYITDIFGVPLLQNKLNADSFAHAGYPVYMPDLFAGDAIPPTSLERGLNLTEWQSRHTPAQIDAILTKTLSYMRNDMGIQRVGAVGYCFGGKYVPRFLNSGRGDGGMGVDVGFIAHPSNLNTSEIMGIGGPISIAAGELDASFNATGRRTAEEILSMKNASVPFQMTLYSGAPHGFGVRVNASIPEQAFAKQGSFCQALTWFDFWL